MNTHVIKKSKYCSGTIFDPEKNEYSVSIRIESDILYLDLVFAESKKPKILLNARVENTYSHIHLENVTTFEKFKQLFYILSGYTFDFNKDSWEDFECN